MFYFFILFISPKPWPGFCGTCSIWQRPRTWWNMWNTRRIEWKVVQLGKLHIFNIQYYSLRQFKKFRIGSSALCRCLEDEVAGPAPVPSGTSNLSLPQDFPEHSTLFFFYIKPEDLWTVSVCVLNHCPCSSSPGWGGEGGAQVNQQPWGGRTRRPSAGGDAWFYLSRCPRYLTVLGDIIFGLQQRNYQHWV